MAFLVVGLIIVAIIFLPGIWVQNVLSRYSSPDDRYSGSGADLARHLLDRYGMQAVKVEETDQGAVDQVTRMWQACGATVTTMSVEHHDSVLAAV